MLRANPNLIEINTRLWIKNLREKYNFQEMTISSIPDEEWLNLKHLGFDAIWLVGVWQCGQRACQLAKDEKNLIKEAEEFALPKEEISCSPYSITEYKLDKELGFNWELKVLKNKLNNWGLSLLLDFVSNHMAIDNAFIEDDIFIETTYEEYLKNKEMFFIAKKNELERYIAYGKDPNFPSWKDTAQLNYFNPKTREKMKKNLLSLLEVCDGVRCDMVMLSLNDVHEGTWGWLLYKQGFNKPEKEFWEEIINEAKEIRSDFVFLAEVYWGLEWKLQQMGFDYTYDKVIYDRLKSTNPEEVKGHLRAEILYQKKSVRYIDNHDENPSIKIFGKEKSLAAAVIISTIKGMRFYNDMQIKGLEKRIPLQFPTINIDNLKNLEIEKFYEKILRISDHPAFHGGEWNLLETFPITEEDKSNKNFIVFSWIQRRTMKIVIVNYSSEISSCKVKVSLKSKGDIVLLYEEFSERFFPFKNEEVKDGLPLIKINPYNFLIFDVDL